MIEVQLIERIVSGELAGTNLFAAAVKVLRDNHIIVLLDGPGGVSVSDCVRVSRAIEGSLDREKEDFALDVSSFGVGTPLIHARQYQINLGRQAKVTLKDGTILQGEIVAAGDAAFSLKTPAKGKKLPEEVFEILFENCLKTQITVSFK